MEIIITIIILPPCIYDNPGYPPSIYEKIGNTPVVEFTVNITTGHTKTALFKGGFEYFVRRINQVSRV